MLAAHAVTTIPYLVRKELGAAAATRTIAALLKVFSLAPVDGLIVQAVLEWRLPDFENSVTAAAEHFASCDFIVTRDPKGFRGSPVRGLTPEAAIPLLEDR